jgi:hypothetical protein
MLLTLGLNSVRAHGFEVSSGSLPARLKTLADYNFVWFEEAGRAGPNGSVGGRERKFLDKPPRRVGNLDESSVIGARR